MRRHLVAGHALHGNHKQLARPRLAFLARLVLNLANGARHVRTRTGFHRGNQLRHGFLARQAGDALQFGNLIQLALLQVIGLLVQSALALANFALAPL